MDKLYIEYKGKKHLLEEIIEQEQIKQEEENNKKISAENDTDEDLKSN